MNAQPHNPPTPAGTNPCRHRITALQVDSQGSILGTLHQPPDTTRRTDPLESIIWASAGE